MGSTCQVGTCLDNGGTASGHPPEDRRQELGTAFCPSWLSPPFTGGETEARGDSAHTSRAVGGEEECVGSREDAG